MKYFKVHRPFSILFFIAYSIIFQGQSVKAADGSLEPYFDNPWHWMYRGEPVFLFGGSDDDNLFQWPEEKLVEHLDLLVSVGGNFLRNTLSTRDDGNTLPYKLVNGRFEFSEENDLFWDKLGFFLRETKKRNIFVQLTLWDQHDFVAKNWTGQFWNPNNNNIGLEGSELYNGNDFFNVVRERNALVLPYQIKYVEKVLTCSLLYDHVFYNISNEGWAGLEWETYWAAFIHSEAKKANTRVQVTSMEHGPQLSVDAVLKYPELFSYVEISQNNNYSTGYRGVSHYRHILDWRRQIEDTNGPRPFMNEKIYGGPGQQTAFSSETDAIRRFWRNVFAGCASVRFHRPNGGLGLNETARSQLRCLNTLNQSIQLTTTSPDLVIESSVEEAYCLASSPGEFALYLPDGGAVTLVVSDGSYELRAMDIASASWKDPSEIQSTGQTLALDFPSGETSLVWLRPL